jgi:hypothetical protein
MTQQQEIVQGDAHQKLGSAGFIIGVLLWLIGSILISGIVASASNLQEELKKIGEQVVLAQAGELTLALSSLAVMMGVAGIYHVITDNGAAWARLGFYVIVVGTIFWTVGYAIDIAVASAMANWLAAPTASKEAAYSVVATLSAMSRGAFPMTVVIYWLAFVFLGIGMVRSVVCPRWLGWFGLILGATGVPLGIIQTFNGRESTFNLFMILFPLTMLWFFVMGIWVARKAWSRTIVKSADPKGANYGKVTYQAK